MTAAAIWPDDVPQWALQESFEETPEENRVEFQPEVGPPKRRRRTSISADMFNFGTTMTSDQYDALIDFWRVALKDGTLPFRRSHPRKPSDGNLRFMFVSKPSYKAGGPDFGNVSLALRRVP